MHKLFVISLTLLAFGTAAASDISPAPPNDVKVIAIRLDKNGFHPQKVHLDFGSTVILRFENEAAVRRFLVPRLEIDRILEAGKPTEIRLTPFSNGTFRSAPDPSAGTATPINQLLIIVEQDPGLFS